MKKFLLIVSFVWVALAGARAETYYWVGGASGSWVAASFASTTGGAGGAGVPTTGDDVYFDSNSGSNISVALGGATTIANLNVSTGGTITFTAAFTLTMSNSLTFSNATKLSASPSSNGFGFSLGNGSTFALTGCDANNYFRGNANGYFIINTTSTGLTLFFDPDNSVGYGAINAAKGIATIGSSVNTQRITFGTNTNNFNQGLVLAPNATLTISGNGSCSFNQTTNCQGIDASASGSKVVITSQNSTILNTTSGNRVFKPGAIINYLEFNRSSATFVLPQAITVTNLALTLGAINNSTNNITLSDGGTITRTAGTLTSTLASYGNSPNVIYNGTADLITSHELPATVASLTVNTPTKTISLDGANTTITNALYLTAGTLSFSDTKTITFDGGLNTVDVYRTAGQISRSSGTSTPIFNSNVNLIYNGSTLITTGFEWPFSGVRLTNLTLNNNSGITMGASRTINGVLQLTAGTLNTSDKILTLKGSIVGSGTINTSTTGTIVFAGSTVQNLSSANLTGSSVNVLTVNPGVKLTTSGDITSTTLNIQSNLANGTATVVNEGALTATTTNVEQYLSSGRQWWYLASPLSGATSNVIRPTDSPNLIGEYTESTTSYSAPFAANSATALTPGKGYVVKFPNTDARTITFTGGSLNTGDKPATVTRTGTTAAKRGFNLVGNPYPSFIDWDLVYANATGMRNAIWMRTFNGSAMTFYTYGDGDGVPVDLASDRIAPMQAFWVKVDADNTTPSLTFKNTHRDHFTTGANPLRVKANDLRPRLRLVVSNGQEKDETLIVGKSYASNLLDSYDIEKMSADNTSIPELFSLVQNQEMVINSMQELNDGKLVQLGFRPGLAGNYTLEVTQLENIDVKAVLVDHLTSSQTELQAGTNYSFSSDATATNSRFSVEFRAPGTTTSLKDVNASNTFVYVTDANQIAVQSMAITKADVIRVYNMAGQQLAMQNANGQSTLLKQSFSAGVYLVKVNNHLQKVIVK